MRYLNLSDTSQSRKNHNLQMLVCQTLFEKFLNRIACKRQRALLPIQWGMFQHHRACIVRIEQPRIRFGKNQNYKKYIVQNRPFQTLSGKFQHHKARNRRWRTCRFLSDRFRRGTIHTLLVQEYQNLFGKILHRINHIQQKQWHPSRSDTFHDRTMSSFEDLSYQTRSGKFQSHTMHTE